MPAGVPGGVMEAAVALPRLLQLKPLITALLFEARVAPADAHGILVNALLDVEGEEWKDHETTDQLLLESIDRQCQRYAEEMGRPYRGLRQEVTRRARR